MSSVISAIVSTVGAVLTLDVKSAWGGIKDLVDAVWKDVIVSTIEFVFSLLGITDEDITTVQCLSQRVMSDDTDNIAMIAALAHQKNNTPILSTLAKSYATIKARYGSYDRSSDQFIDGRPSSSITVRVVDKEAVRIVLNSINGKNNTIKTTSLVVPKKDKWCKYVLQGTHGYKPYSNELIYAGVVYRYSSATYNYVSDKYEVLIERLHTVTTDEYARTVVSIINKNATTDYKTTTVHKVLVHSSSINGSSEEIIGSTSSTVEVPIGTVSPSSTNVLINEGPEIVEVYTTATIEVSAHSAVQRYVVTYEWVVGEWYYWIYDPAVGTYPTLSQVYGKAEGLEMLPIVALRSNKVNVTSDKLGSRYLTSKEVLRTIGVDIDQIIDGIAKNPNIADISSAYMHFAIGLTDTSPVISKALYALAETVYNSPGVLETVSNATVGTEKVLSFTIREGDFNQVAKWADQRRNVVTGVIGTVGTCTHTVDTINITETTTDSKGNSIPSVRHGARLTVRYQELEESYVEYQFDDMTSMTWINYGGFGNMCTLSPIGDSADSFCIPLSMFFVNKLSGKEQQELFVKTLRISFYAVQVTHLEWYETKAFGMLLQGVAIVILIYSLGTASEISEALMVVATAIASSYALKKILESSAPDWLKAVAAVAYVYVNLRAGGGLEVTTNVVITGVMIVSLTTSAFMIALGIKMTALENEADVFNRKAKERAEENEKKQELLASSNLDTGLLTQMITATSMSPSTQYDIAKGKMLYDQGLLYDGASRSKDFYSNAFNIGVR